jgi:hypothetical protein
MTKSDIIRNRIANKIKRGKIDLSLKRGKLTSDIIEEICIASESNSHYVRIIAYDYIIWLKQGGRLRKDEKHYRLVHTNKRNEHSRRNYMIGMKYDYNRHTRYTREEEDMILGKYNGTDRQLGKLIKRSVKGIQVKRAKLNEEK